MKDEDILPTTKTCPDCNNTHLALFGRDNLKICTDCDPHVRIPWYLTDEQKEDYL